MDDEYRGGGSGTQDDEYLGGGSDSASNAAGPADRSRRAFEDWLGQKRRAFSERGGRVQAGGRGGGGGKAPVDGARLGAVAGGL
eukprot:scaffold18311_cov39-Isochrysis_galbana.AAC.1